MKAPNWNEYVHEDLAIRCSEKKSTINNGMKILKHSKYVGVELNIIYFCRRVHIVQSKSEYNFIYNERRIVDSKFLILISILFFFI